MNGERCARIEARVAQNPNTTKADICTRASRFFVPERETAFDRNSLSPMYSGFLSAQHRHLLYGFIHRGTLLSPEIVILSQYTNYSQARIKGTTPSLRGDRVKEVSVIMVNIPSIIYTLKAGYISLLILCRVNRPWSFGPLHQGLEILFAGPHKLTHPLETVH